MASKNMIDISGHTEGPLYVRIAEAVCAAVAQGKLGAGDKIPPRHTLARQLNVNPSTVCYAYDQLENQGIIVSKRGSGTYVLPDAVERIRHRKARLFSCLTVVLGAKRLTDFHPDRLFLITDILESVVRELAFPVPMVYVESLDQQAGEAIPADGAVLLIDSSKTEANVINQLIERGVPTVSAWDPAPATPHVPHVHYDVRQAASLACDHLIACGYRRIGYVGSKVTESGGIVTKFFEFVSRLHDAGLDLRAAHLRIVGNEPGRAYRAAMDLANSDDRPEALFIDTDAKAIEALHAFQDAGLSVPRDIGIVGYNGSNEAAHCTPPLTTVRTPRDLIGRRVAELLTTWPKDGSAPDLGTPEKNLLKGTLQIGQTTAYPQSFHSATSLSTKS